MPAGLRGVAGRGWCSYVQGLVRIASRHDARAEMPHEPGPPERRISSSEDEGTSSRGKS